MLLNRTRICLAVGALVLTIGSRALAQDLQTMELFGPAEVSSYGSGIQPKEGYFFRFDALHWSISRPGIVEIGFPGLTRQVFHNPSTEEIQYNSHDTGPIGSDFTSGTRIEFGRASGRHGWFISTTRLNSQTQHYEASDVDIVFQDIAFGSEGHQHLEGWSADMIGDMGGSAIYIDFQILDLPINFDDMRVENRMETWGVEVMCLHRMRPTHFGGFIELFAGVRYLEVDESFSVDARGEDDQVNNTTVEANSRFVFDQDGEIIFPGTVLADSRWIAEADNRVIGPQVGARWSRKTDRWTLSAEGRFMAGFNNQRVHTEGVLGSELDAANPFTWSVTPPANPGDPVVGAFQYPFVPLLTEPYNFNHTRHLPEFSPAVELRLEANYQLTRAVTFKAGWTGFWMSNVARASDIIDYTISEASVMGIDASSNDQDILIHGLNIGLDVNH